MSTGFPRNIDESISIISYITNWHSHTYFVVILGIVWGIYDPVSTYIAFEAAGSVKHEANPLIRQAMLFHPSMLFVIKFVAVGSVVLLSHLGRKHITAMPYWRVFYSCWIVFGVIVGTVNLYAAHVLAVTG